MNYEIAGGILAAVIAALRASRKVDELHITVNGRMAALLAETRRAGELAGIAAERLGHTTDAAVSAMGSAISTKEEDR